MADKYDRLAAGLLLRDPQTDDKLIIASPPVNNSDGSFSFEVENPATRARYRHTIKTEEI